MSRPYIWAHRGADGYAPENTLPAFQMAADMGADGVELDVQLTKDGQIVVCHDERLDRTSNGKGWLNDFTLVQLKEMDFSGGNKEYAGVQIPTLREVLELLKDTGMYVDLELKTKTFPYPGIERKCINLIKEMGYDNRVIFCSFNHLSLQKIRLLAPEMKIGYLYLHAAASLIPFAKKLGVDALHITQRNILVPGFVEKCAEQGIAINAWTINNEKEYQCCADNGVHAVITDYPDRVRQFRDTYSKQESKEAKNGST